MSQARKNKASEPIRASLHKKLGELIFDVTGNPFVQQFYAAKNNPAEPAGQIAENLGAVDQEVKIALLLAQAAERTLDITEKIDSLYARNRHRSRFNQASQAEFAAHDRIFQYAGSPDDPENLRMAQANWQLAQIYLNLEKASKDRGVEQRVFSPAYINAFKKQARSNFEEAAEMLDEKGYADVAFQLRLTAQRYGAVPPVPETPHVFALSLRDNDAITPEIREKAAYLAEITKNQRGAEGIILRSGYNHHAAPG